GPCADADLPQVKPAGKFFCALTIGLALYLIPLRRNMRRFGDRVDNQFLQTIEIVAPADQFFQSGIVKKKALFPNKEDIGDFAVRLKPQERFGNERVLIDILLEQFMELRQFRCYRIYKAEW